MADGCVGAGGCWLRPAGGWERRSRGSRGRTGGRHRDGADRRDALGVTLMHEHVLVDFIGAAEVSRSRYDADAVVAMVLPYLRQVRALGCQTIVECTPAYLGRDPRLLQRLSRRPACTILSNTGYYGAAEDKHVPAFAFTETVEQLAARWIREAERGIDDTAIKPAFMKIGVDAAPLSEIDAKLVRAAARTHRETGLPIASHTGTGAAAMAELDLLEAAGVPPSAFIWVHAQSERDGTFHVRAARRGAWVEFDGISPSSLDASPRARAAHEEPRCCWNASSCRTTPAGTTSASREAGSSVPTRRSSPTSCRA